ncbi:MAG: bifunctional riboflavin kinase/FAD synthetase [Desulfamplus sp.]|nr:bifunctional riboflavin kinase/FAD synthetase [Desulfamplus sp.]
MELIEDIDKIKEPYTRAVVTIGNFDGVHRGHQTLFKKVMDRAREISGTSVAITFEPHPLKVLGKNGPPLITRKDQKIELITASGIEKVICIPFTESFAAISAQEFVTGLLIDKIGMHTIIVGPDYSFGRDREGDIDFLVKAGKKEGFDVVVPDWFCIPKVSGSTGDERISSTMIRNIVMEGRVEDAPRYLGRYYQIRGKVIKGRERGGSRLGFPTANIKLHDELCPKMGVYAVTVETVRGTHTGVANIGYSPTFDDNIFTIEVHILDFCHDIYGTRIRVNMVSRLRDEKKFSGIAELSARIASDIEMAREIFKTIQIFPDN